jgi:transcriptional/translational regulatory protein YebC/TACO1
MIFGMELLRRSTAIFRPRTSQFVNPRRFAGHNKWSKIKHRKATADMGKSKLVAKLTREIRAAVREGGADTNHNLQLASAVSKAREMDIPKATIQAAINIASVS